MTDQSLKTLSRSHRELLPQSTHLREVDDRERIEVSIYLKAPPFDEGRRLERHELLAERMAANRADLDQVVAFTESHGLTVVAQDAARLMLRVAGPAKQMQQAFGTRLAYYHHASGSYRGRSGPLSLPPDIADRVLSVLGLDTRPAAKPHFVAHIGAGQAVGHLPNQVAALYGFPTDVTGAGQTVALIELGGGYRATDTATAAAAMGIVAPTVVSISVDGTGNAPGGAEDPEVALDIQVVAGSAPGARIAVYFAANTDKGLCDAVATAIHDAQYAPTVISISWGAAENTWGQQTLDTMQQMLQDAAQLGITVIASAGDNLAGGDAGLTTLNVDFPASVPYALSCGGVLSLTQGGQIVSQSVWNSRGQGTGGGISGYFPVPAYQQGLALVACPSTGKPGRGVPDVAGDADPASGYRIFLNGMSGVTGGTSAVAPLWAGLVALINQARAEQSPAKRSVGYINPLLYADTAGLTPVTVGDNFIPGTQLGYAAGPGYSCCTGLGVPANPALVTQLVSAP
jgi:kumamolisin